MKRALVAMLAAAFGGLSAPGAAAGGGGFGNIVYDPWNFAENQISAVRNIGQLRQNILQTQNDLVQIQQIYDLLARADLDLAPAERLYNSRINVLENQMNEAGGLSYEYEAINAGYQKVYPDWKSADGETFGEYKEQTRVWRQTAWDNVVGAMKSHAIQPVLEEDRVSLHELLLKNNDAEGNLEAMQIATQVAGIIANQLITLNQMTSQHFRAQAVLWANKEKDEQEEFDYVRRLRCANSGAPGCPGAAGAAQ